MKLTRSLRVAEQHRSQIPIEKTKSSLLMWGQSSAKPQVCETSEGWAKQIHSMGRSQTLSHGLYYGLALIRRFPLRLGKADRDTEEEQPSEPWG